MGTRADFYVGIGPDIKWLGSIGYDGYPSGIPKSIKESTNEKEYEKLVIEFLKQNDAGTLPEMGWPWPWDNGINTDYSYFFYNGIVFVSHFGSDATPIKYIKTDEDEEQLPPRDAIQISFPDMKHIQNVVLGGKRSGLIVFKT